MFLFHLFFFSLLLTLLIQTDRAGAHCKSTAISELKLNIKRIRDCYVRVLFSNTRTCLPYNELEIFNAALSFASCSIENFPFIVREGRACIWKQNTHNSL